MALKSAMPRILTKKKVHNGRNTDWENTPTETPRGLLSLSRRGCSGIVVPKPISQKNITTN